ncbi:unnamed protein product [Nippostrongylus brasiliensis]|uniref:Cytochrome P450 n=1 Tax=Nippostrongylus brasiliensis TaxID=27835 RepID=A0A0N4YMH8_NIPBR|nr:unnamed protein product [Nippostrongylus brasiliensis]
MRQWFATEDSGRGLVISNGSFWQEQRRFSLQVLRDLGVSKNIVEERIMAEFDLSSLIYLRLCTTYGQFKKEEDRFYELKNKLDESIERLNVVDMFIKQWVLNTPILNSRWNRLKKPIQDVKGFIKKQIAERFEAIENGDHVLDSSQPQDYVDAFIAKMRDEEEKGNAETTFE